MRKRLDILDALRGIAALMVVCLHLNETYHWSPGHAPILFGHAYLAVEFFLMLMGFMLGYAYDERKIGVGEFCLRRLRRLHPLVVFGSVLGLCVFFFVGRDDPWVFGAFEHASAATIAGVFALTLVMCPVGGYGAINPFNGCSWTLFYEYVGNLLYILFVKRLPKWALAALTAISFALLVSLVMNLDLNKAFGTNFALFAKLAARLRYTLVGGFSLSPVDVWKGSMRLLFPMLAGLLIYRMKWRLQLGRHALAIAAAVFFAALAVPEGCKVGAKTYSAWSLGTPDTAWVNGIYELFVVAVVFPLLIAVGSGSDAPGERSRRACAWLGGLSYPLYMVHYPFIYIQIHWGLKNWNRFPVPAMVLLSVAQLVLSVLFALAVKRWYDDPVSKALGNFSRQGIAGEGKK